jgi:thioredoxin reductase
MNQKADYLIIGAGIIGLAIARELRSRYPESEILVAGEKEFLYEKFNREHGVPLVKPIVDDLINEGAKIGVAFDAKPVSES